MKKPIGSEWYRNDGMVLVKIENEKWIYKQRKVWLDYYGKIPKDNFIIFLDGNRNNYDIENLACVNRREASLIANYRLVTNNQDLTKTGIELAKLLVMLKEKQGIKTCSHKKRK